MTLVPEGALKRGTEKPGKAAVDATNAFARVNVRQA